MISKALNLAIVLFLAGASGLFSQQRDSKIFDGTFNVLSYGAKGDGVTLDTDAIQATIDACAENGGTVIFPAGAYLSGTIVLKSNVTLYFSAGATLLGSTNIRDYPEFTVDIPSYNDSFLRHSLIFANGAENIALTGRGTIDGQGGAFEVTTKKRPDRYRNRPFGIRFVQCKNVLVENVTLQNSAMWMQQYFACDGVTIRGIKVFNHSNKNNDMIDIDSSRNVIMSDCFGDTDDDAITIKSTTGLVTENVTITNCVVSSHVNAIKLGTESHGGFRNITISNIVVKPSSKTTTIYGVPKGIGGITLGMVDGGVLDGVTISNIRIDGAETPIFMRLGNRGRVYKEGMPKPAVGTFRNVKISNVIATGASDTGCSITGIPGHSVEDISLRDIKIVFSGGGSREDAAIAVPENEDGYPGSKIFGKLPSYGFFIRHVKNLSLSNIDLSFEEPDYRPALIFDDVRGLDIAGLRAQGTLETSALIKLINTENVLISQTRLPSEIGVFMAVEGSQSKNIRLFGNDLMKTGKVVEFVTGAETDAVELLGNFGSN